jgi:pSer/pThr/pTyr-binding forkhead associated (FHA) protein
MALRLNIDEDGKKRAVTLSGMELTIGRGAENGVVIADPRSSRQHCRIVRTPQGLLLEDMSSRNGTLLNGTTVTKSFVKPGDEFRVGNVRFVVEDPADAPAAPSTIEDDDDLLLDDEESAEPGPAPSGASLAETRVGSSHAGAAPAAAARQAPARPAPKADAKAPPALELEGLEGHGAGTRIPVTRTPFTIGRSRDCELPIEDKKASGKHARILREGERYLIEDLGSTNGTLVDRRPVQRGAIGPGAVIQIGNSSFRAIVAGVGAQAGRAAPGEEFVDFDVEKFLARDRSQHPLAVGALLLILGVVGYFTVDIAVRLGRREDPDPSPAANLIPANWSFEEVRAGTPGVPGVPGWSIAGGDSGSIEAIDSHAQVPGRRALRLRSAGTQDLCRAVHEASIVLPRERRYRLEGYVLNEGAFAAGVAVEWLRASREDETGIERSYSDTARQSGESLDVDQIVTAPSYATQARVCAFVLGSGGTAVFDRIRFAPADAEAGATPPVEGAAAEEDRTDGSRRLTIGEDAAFDLILEDSGTVSLEASRGPPAATLWCGLDPDLDPLGLGPRLAMPRGEPGDGDAFLLIGYVPDLKERRWVQLETSAARAGDDAVLRFRTAKDGDSPPDLSLYIDTREPWIAVPAPGSAAADPGSPVPAREIVLGERRGRISLSFSADVTAEAHPHPSQPSRRIVRVRGGGHRLETSISAGSKHESSLARAHLERAEEEFRAGRIGAAMGMLSKTKTLFPEEAAELSRAESRLAEWRALAGEALASLEREIAALRETPSPVVKGIVMKRAAILKDRFAGTSEAETAARHLAEVESIWDSLASKKSQEEVSSYLERARSHLAAGELALAELYFHWVAESDPDGDLGKSARNQIKIIEGRRARDVRILLQ